jgi:hypothetical protein
VRQQLQAEALPSPLHWLLLVQVTMLVQVMILASVSVLASVLVH